MKSKLCDNGGCRGEAFFAKYCGAYVCSECRKHVGLTRCFCGWSESGGDGLQELIDMGETIDDGYDEGMAMGGDAYNDVMFGEPPDY